MLHISQVTISSLSTRVLNLVFVRIGIVQHRISYFLLLNSLVNRLWIDFDFVNPCKPVGALLSTT